jgi:molybdate transport system substrate-binding protein
MNPPRAGSSRLVIALAVAGIALLVAIVLLNLLRPRDGEPVALRVAAAISLQPALDEIAQRYRQSGGAVELSYGSSGQLMGQISAGAPIDLFISAAHQQVDELGEKGLVGQKRIIATNTLVLVVPADAEHAPAGFAALAEPQVTRLAIGEPQTVPAGMYARQVLDELGLSESLGDRLVYGSNVRQVLSYVERGEVSAGIVYSTDARESGGKVRLIATAEADWHDPIEYPAALVTGTGRGAAAEAFFTFLASAECRAIFERHGFGPPR